MLLEVSKLFSVRVWYKTNTTDSNGDDMILKHQSQGDSQRDLTHRFMEIVNKARYHLKQNRLAANKSTSLSVHVKRNQGWKIRMLRAVASIKKKNQNQCPIAEPEPVSDSDPYD